MLTSRDGDQYLLDLRSPEGAVQVPWQGRSPRGLTRVALGVILKAQAGKSMSDFVSDENQYDLWVSIKRLPWVYQGAPLLRDLEGS